MHIMPQGKWSRRRRQSHRQTLTPPEVLLLLAEQLLHWDFHLLRTKAENSLLCLEPPWSHDPKHFRRNFLHPRRRPGTCCILLQWGICWFLHRHMLLCLEQNRTLILFMFYTCLLVYILLVHSYLVFILSNFSSSYFTFLAFLNFCHKI